LDKVGDVKTLLWLLLLPVFVGAGVALHILLGRTLKAILWAASPLATGEAEAFAYERRVYGTADIAMAPIVGTAVAAGVLAWAGAVIGKPWSAWVAAAAVLTLLGALALDLWRWERVAASASCLWFQRGCSGTVHQVAMENIRKVSVEEAEVRGFTLRHGMRNRTVRLQVKMSDKRVAAMPKTDAHVAAVAEVHAMKDFVRLRMQQINERESGPRKPPAAEPVAVDAAVASADSSETDLKRALKRLQRTAPGS
jgi:hypothetical protein